MGVGTNRMNRYTVGMATQGLANYILSHCKEEDPKVVISYDSRNNSKEFARITADVLSANGIHVYIFDNIRPTPEMSYAVRLKGAVAGVMITASHNPKEYNGYKVSWSDGGQVTSPVDKDIVAEVAKITDPSMVKFKAGLRCGEVEAMGADVDEKYLSDLLSLSLSPELCEKHGDLKIVYTPLHGCGVRMIPEILKRKGFKNIIHVPDQDVSDGDFPTVVSPNPEEPAAMKMALERADEVGADIVMASDPDADRLGIAVRDNNGKMVQFNGNQTASMLTYYILTRWKELGKLDGTKYCVKTIVTTQLIADICKKFGVECYDVLTGFKFIGEQIGRLEEKGRADSYVFGFEESYGYLSGSYVRDKDAVDGAFLICEMFSYYKTQGKSLLDRLEELYAEYGYCLNTLHSYTFEGSAGFEKMQNIMKTFRAASANASAAGCYAGADASFRDANTDALKEFGSRRIEKLLDYAPGLDGLPKSDVLKYLLEDHGSVVIRPSGTEPKLKAYISVSAKDRAVAQEMEAKIAAELAERMK
jgi:phosphoglucomutase